MNKKLLWTLVCFGFLHAETIRVAGLKQPAEVLRDRWGVPHIYAQNTGDLFFLNGYINARDRLFQLDLWRRVGTGKLAEVLGPSHIARDRMARLFVFRGDWNAEWRSYAPDTHQILIAFTNGINAYIKSLDHKRPVDFQAAGYDPGLWIPEDCLSRVAGLAISRNAISEVTRAQNIARFGLQKVLQLQPFEPKVALTVPPGLQLAEITPQIVRDLSAMISASPFAQGSNNWVVDGSRTAAGKPLLASDPHRDLEIPSLRKTVHLVAPGWNIIGANEPALPGISIGHNDQIAFGYTITGTDQQDVYVEKLNPQNPDEYWYNGAWKRIAVVKEKISVKDEKPRDLELSFTVHGPVIYEDRANLHAYSLRWVGNDAGGAGYLSMLSSSRAKNWNEFRDSMARFKVPSENMVYADVAGNIGYIAAGAAPIRKNWTGLLPAPGTGEYEWSGLIPYDQMPMQFNPPKHSIATANNNILPAGYNKTLTYEWGPPYRAQRIEELLAEKRKFTASDFERIQYDVLSIPARRFQKILSKWHPALTGRTAEVFQRVLHWDARMTPDSVPGLVFEIWFAKVMIAISGNELAAHTSIEVILDKLEKGNNAALLLDTLQATVREFEKYLGDDMNRWQLVRIMAFTLRHPLNRPEWNRGPVLRGGDPNTLNAGGGGGARQPAGASYRQVIDLADWDHSTMTNFPGESGDPTSPHYSDLIADWSSGQYHPMAFSRKAVEAVTVERMSFQPR